MANKSRNPFEEPLEPLTLLNSPNISRASIDTDGQPDESSRLATSAHPANAKGVPNTGHENISRHLSSNDNPAESSRPLVKETQLHDTRNSWLGRKINVLVEALELGHAEPVRVGDPPIGEARRKHHIHQKDIIAMIVSLLCLLVSVVVVAPGPVAWELGLKRQLQVVGLTLSIMDTCRKSLISKVFLMAEAQFGKSYLQNYDAILRNSMTVPHMAFLWRFLLLSMILLPTGLSLAYKEFFSGTTAKVLQQHGGYYGLAAPGQLAVAGGTSNGGILGISAMVNATLPFIQAAANDSEPPQFSELPKAFGFNTLLLSNTSAAFLDAPMPDYVSSIQQNLAEQETWLISARVHATITTYNNTPESHREDDDFWAPYFDTKNEVFHGTGGIQTADLFDGSALDLLVNNYNWLNATWSFLALAPHVSGNDEVNNAFQAKALQFDTRRDMCDGTWLVKKVSIQLVSGACNYPPLPAFNQEIITNNTFAFTTYYLPILSEYLGPFAIRRNQSQWLLPTFTMSVAGMYWSRMLAINGFYAWGGDTSIDKRFDPAEVYYPVSDHIVSTKTTMNTSWLLYLILAIQPSVILAAYVASWMFYRTPIDGDFGLIPILAGVRQETLRLLSGASMSGRVAKPIRMQIVVNDPVVAAGKPAPPKLEYILGGQDQNGTLAPQIRYRLPFVGERTFQRGFKRHGTEYEMI